MYAIFLVKGENREDANAFKRALNPFAFLPIPLFVRKATYFISTRLHCSIKINSTGSISYFEAKLIYVYNESGENKIYVIWLVIKYIIYLSTWYKNKISNYSSQYSKCLPSTCTWDFLFHAVTTTSGQQSFHKLANSSMFSWLSLKTSLFGKETQCIDFDAFFHTLRTDCAQWNLSSGYQTIQHNARTLTTGSDLKNVFPGVPIQLNIPSRTHKGACDRTHTLSLLSNIDINISFGFRLRRIWPADYVQLLTGPFSHVNSTWSRVLHVVTCPARDHLLAPSLFLLVLDAWE